MMLPLFTVPFSNPQIDMGKVPEKQFKDNTTERKAYLSENIEKGIDPEKALLLRLTMDKNALLTNKSPSIVPVKKLLDKSNSCNSLNPSDIVNGSDMVIDCKDENDDEV